MNYIYDILANFNEVYYDFYEWEKKDNISHIKRIPIIKIDKNCFNDIVTHQFKISVDLMKKIKNKTEIWNHHDNNDTYCLLLTNGTDVIGIEFDKLGKSINRSSLLIDEELDILQTVKKLDQQVIDYKLLRKINKSFSTRNEIKNRAFLIEELKKLSKQKNIKKINYLYFECFNKTESNYKLALNTIIKNMDNTNISNILYNFFNLIKTSSK